MWAKWFIALVIAIKVIKEQKMSKEMYEILAALDKAAELMFAYGLNGYAEEVGMMMGQLEAEVQEVE
jgi:hypothetical protein